MSDNHTPFSAFSDRKKSNNQTAGEDFRAFLLFVSQLFSIFAAENFYFIAV
jgi:hypothetical protein